MIFAPFALLTFVAPGLSCGGGHVVPLPFVASLFSFFIHDIFVFTEYLRTFAAHFVSVKFYVYNLFNYLLKAGAREGIGLFLILVTVREYAFYIVRFSRYKSFYKYKEIA